MLKKIMCSAFTASLLIACQSTDTSVPVIEIQTSEGNIRACIFTDKAPITAKRYMDYVDAGEYDDTSFYRVVRDDNQPNNKVKIDVIQGGRSRWDGNVLSDMTTTLPDLPHETTEQTGLRHTPGALSMARVGPGTANDHIFIAVENEPELDFGGKRNPDGQGFAVFGQVVDGMDVVEKIQQLPQEGQMLKPPIVVSKVIRVGKRACSQ